MIGLAAASFFLGGVGRRICGGGLNQWVYWSQTTDKRVFGDTPTRILWAVCLAVCALLGSAVWWHSLLFAALLVPAEWVGTTTGLFNSLAMGRGDRSFIHDFLGMSLHGVLSVILPGLAAWWLGYGWWWIVISGLVISPCYVAGWSITGRHPNVKFPPGLQMGSDVAEVIWGGVMGLGVFLAAVSQ